MNSIRNLIYCLLLTLLFPVNIKAQISAGVDESTYIYGKYHFNGNLNIKLQHSLYSEKFGFQRVAVGIGYHKHLPYGFNCNFGLTGATTWNGNYQVVFSDILLGYNYRRIGCNVIIQPRYDSGLGYETCWGGSISYKVITPLSVIVGYTTIPQYRMSERRISGGLEFRVMNLTVTPKVSVSLQNNSLLKNMRVLMSMNYNF